MGVIETLTSSRVGVDAFSKLPQQYKTPVKEEEPPAYTKDHQYINMKNLLDKSIHVLQDRAKPASQTQNKDWGSPTKY